MDNAMRAAGQERGSILFQVYAIRDPVGSPERTVWCVTSGGREMGRFNSAESALRAAMAYARALLQKGEATSALVSRARPDGTAVTIHLVPYQSYGAIVS